MKITQCLHTALLVSNLERAEYFYGTVLSLRKVERTLKVPGAWYQIDGFQIHLIQASFLASELQNPGKWGRNRHVAFSVENLEEAKEHLLTYHCPVQISASGRAALFTQDPDGNVIELSEVNR